MAEAIFQKPLNKRIKRLIDGLTYQAVKSGNNWILPSGTNAAAGEYITVDGVLGQATAAIVGGTDAIVENTNWAPEGTGGAINALKSKFRYIGTLSSGGDTVNLPQSYHNLYAIMRATNPGANYRAAQSIILPKEYVDSITQYGSSPNEYGFITIYYINGYSSITKSSANTLRLYEVLSGYKFEIYVD